MYTVNIVFAGGDMALIIIIIRKKPTIMEGLGLRKEELTSF